MRIAFDKRLGLTLFSAACFALSVTLVASRLWVRPHPPDTEKRLERGSPSRWHVPRRYRPEREIKQTRRQRWYLV